MFRILQALGLNVEGGEFRFIEAKNIDKTVQLQAVTQLTEKLGLPIDDDYLYDTFDIEKPENYDQLKAEALKKAEERQAQQDAMMQKLQNGGKDQKPNPKKSQEAKDVTDVNFWNRLKSFFSEAPQDGADFPF